MIHGARGRKWLLETAQAIVIELKPRREGTRLRVRLPSRVYETNTAGWVATIGDLGQGRPKLEIWLDYFTGHDEPKFMACLAGNRGQLMRITDRVAASLVPHRVIASADMEERGYLTLTKPLRRVEFNVPIFDNHAWDETYFGVFEHAELTDRGIDSRFVQEAASFFESVARTLPRAKPEDDSHDVYPRIENRLQVRLHLKRERSRLLATARKQSDDYECQVCGLRFADVYGPLGAEFAEAHHLVPLGKLREAVKTKLKDLATVCANCHRMLHRMDGERDDIQKLRTIVLRRRAKQH